MCRRAESDRIALPRPGRIQLLPARRGQGRPGLCAPGHAPGRRCGAAACAECAAARSQIGLRYRVLGGFSFYQRAEVKGALAYVRLAMRPDDDVALLRVLNVPPRGIGKATVDVLRELAEQRGASLWAAIAELVESAATRRALAPLKAFRELIEGLQAELAVCSPADFLGIVLDRSGYLDMFENRGDPESAARAENLKELVNAVAEGTERGETLSDYLDRAALVSDADAYDERAPVTLMTLH